MMSNVSMLQMYAIESVMISFSELSDGVEANTESTYLDMLLVTPSAKSALDRRTFPSVHKPKV